MKKPSPTKTTNPIHFEDLDPKRFEDLVRELIYDFKEWQTIEATGRGGDDGGFDIRAYEKAYDVELDDENEESIHPMDGNLWMVQCKREKEIGPSKLKKYLADVDSSSPPYGYILAAPANFSKAAYDVFREELRSRGVMEFYLWGRPDLELLLHQPKNDRILFTFFGVSNVVRRRSRATEIRTAIANKNKITRALGDRPEGRKVLIRDSQDRNYPYPSKYSDFDRRPRWKEFEAVEFHPLGLIVKLKRHWAFADEGLKVFDWADAASLIFENNDDDEAVKQREMIQLVRDYWELLPKVNRAEYHRNGLIRFDCMVAIDEKGDAWNECPHVHVEFSSDKGPFGGQLEYLMKGQRQILLDGYSRIARFPKEYPAPKFGTIFDKESIILPEDIRKQIVNYPDSMHAIFDVDGSKNHLQESDVALVRVSGKSDGFIQITHKQVVTIEDLLAKHPELSWDIKRQIGREPLPGEQITVLEFRTVYEWQFKGRKPTPEQNA